MKRLRQVFFIIIGLQLIGIPLGTLGQTTSTDSETAEPKRFATIELLGNPLSSKPLLAADDCREVSFPSVTIVAVEQCRFVAGQKNDSVATVIMRIKSSGIIFGLKEVRQLTTSEDARKYMKNEYDHLLAKNDDFTRGGVINGDTLSAYVSTGAGVEAFLVDERDQVSVHYQTKQEQVTITHALHQLGNKQPLTKEWKTLQADTWFLKFATNEHQPRTLAPLKLDEETRRFRTRIGQAYDKGEPNFAGRYLIVSWGCGTACQSHAMVDIETGRARLLPLTTSLGILYRKDSRLVISNPQSIFSPESNAPDYTRSEFWVLIGGGLESIPQSVVNTSDVY